MLKQRILTAIVLIPLVLWGIISLPNHYYALLLAVIVVLGAKEWGTMARLSSSIKYVYLVAFVITLYGCWLALQQFDNFASRLLYVACAWWLYAFVALAQYNSGHSRVMWNSLLRSFIGLLVLIPTFISLYVLRSHPQFGAQLVIYLLVLIWLADSAAYFAGRRWGKQKLLPNVSPGKTWQGVYGAMVASISFSIVYALYNDAIQGSQVIIFVLISFVTVVFSIHGDLVESLFKRQVNIKDSGQLLPGHGGMLDRIDSLTAAAPVFVTGLLLMAGNA